MLPWHCVKQRKCKGQDLQTGNCYWSIFCILNLATWIASDGSKHLPEFASILSFT